MFAMNHAIGNIFLLMLFLFNSSHAQELIIKDNLRFLALGDSYTIGQSVLEKERWPNQLGDRLMDEGISVDEVKIIARTGWTTRDLISALEAAPPNFDYNLVSLLIGVNNQFQGRSQTEYKVEFEFLLNMALGYVKNNAENVVVLSIPDYGYTPFGQNYPNASQEIDEFNAINKEITEKYKITYIDATTSSRFGLAQPDLVAGDRLHPSPKMYSIWVDSIMTKATFQKVITHYAFQELKEKPLIYPNPVQDFLILPNETTLIEISDNQGKVIFSSRNLKSPILDVKFLKQGIYWLRIKTFQVIKSTRFVKY
jgi:lysophospholipase L1-like esterase